jgi:dipeptidyl aminopeptidase/acylaminoacyl peptidase
MRDRSQGLVDARTPSNGISRLVVAMGLLLLLARGTPAAAEERSPSAARAGLNLAQEAALSWASDAALVYLENDEPLDGAGAAGRWGYLFYSPTQEKSRVYSLREGKIVVAEYLEMRFEAPPVTPDWIDSGAALAAAERGGGREFREKHAGRLGTMLLMRGAFADDDPDQTTWTLIYTAPDGPSLFIVVDASEGKVRRTWRG